MGVPKTTAVTSARASKDMHREARFRFPRLTYRSDDRRVAVSRRPQCGEAFDHAVLRNTGEQSAGGLGVEQQFAGHPTEAGTHDAIDGEILWQQRRGDAGCGELARARIEWDRRKVELGCRAACLEHLGEMAGE